MKLLATADLHIGRRPSHLPQADARKYSCASVWNSVVDCALREQVDAVLLAGDVVDESNKYFEAVGALESGLQRLAEAGITVLAVAGNHDFDVLPQVARSLDFDGFRLLGNGGTWEAAVLPLSGEPALQVWGWSFPARSVKASPLPRFPSEQLQSGLPAIGLLHADLDSPGSRYCPAGRDELVSCGLPMWVLGHRHGPGRVTDESSSATVFYTGSPQGLDPGPGETGVHGPWIVELKGGRLSARRAPLAAVRYMRLDVCLAGIDDPDTVRNRIMEDLRVAVRDAAAEQGSLQMVSLRLTVSGRCRVAPALVARSCAALQDTGTTVDNVRVHVDEYSLLTRPSINLASLRSGQGPVAETARLIAQLEYGHTDEELDELVAALGRKSETLYFADTFADLAGGSGDAPPDESACRDLLLERAWQLLDTLLRQGEPA